VSQDSKYAAEYPENVEVKDYLVLMWCRKEAYQMLKTGVYMLRALASIRLDEFYFE
jgi:hypothetical protein